MSKVSAFLRNWRTPLSAMIAATHDINPANTTEQAIHFAFLIFAFYWTALSWAAWAVDDIDNTAATNDRAA